jgi:glycerol-3-phosphate acyltransferase PlsY
MTAAVAIGLGYVCGSLPFGYWAGRLRGVDLRTRGSGNTGATNAFRVLGIKIGVLVMALDIGKGALAVVAARAIAGGDLVPVLAAAAAVAGHLFPVFLGFRGGKGAATGTGAMIALVPPIGLLAFCVWVTVGLVTRYVSVATIATAIFYASAAFVSGQPWPVRLFTLGAGAFVVWRHRANIARLRAGTEHRVNLPSLRAG